MKNSRSKKRKRKKSTSRKRTKRKTTLRSGKTYGPPSVKNLLKRKIVPEKQGKQSFQEYLATFGKWDRRELKDIKEYTLKNNQNLKEQFEKITNDAITELISDNGAFGTIFGTKNNLILKVVKKVNGIFKTTAEEFNFEYRLQQILAKRGLAPKVHYGFILRNERNDIVDMFFAMDRGKDVLSNVIKKDEKSLYSHFDKVRDRFNAMLAHGIVCVDAKPGNAVLMGNEVRLIDFGKDFCVILNKPLKISGFIFLSDLIFLTYAIYTLTYTEKGKSFDKDKIMSQILDEKNVIGEDESLSWKKNSRFSIQFKGYVSFLHKLLRRCELGIDEKCKKQLMKIVHEEDFDNILYILDGFKLIFKHYVRIDILYGNDNSKKEKEKFVKEVMQLVTKKRNQMARKILRSIN